MNYQILIPISLILIGGTLIYWLPILFYKGPESFDDMLNLWLLPWLFGVFVAGGYLGWFYSSEVHIVFRVVFTVIGCLLGLVAGVVGFITDPKTEGDPIEQFLTTLGILSFPIGVVIGTLIEKIWVIPGPAIGFFLGPLLFFLLIDPWLSMIKERFS